MRRGGVQQQNGRFGSERTAISARVADRRTYGVQSWGPRTGRRVCKTTSVNRHARRRRANRGRARLDGSPPRAARIALSGLFLLRWGAAGSFAICARSLLAFRIIALALVPFGVALFEVLALTGATSRSRLRCLLGSLGYLLRDLLQPLRQALQWLGDRLRQLTDLLTDLPQHLAHLADHLLARLSPGTLASAL